MGYEPIVFLVLHETWGRVAKLEGLGINIQEILYRVDICTFEDYYKGVFMAGHVDFLKNDVEMDQVKGKCKGQKVNLRTQRFPAIKRKKKECLTYNRNKSNKEIQCLLFIRK